MTTQSYQQQAPVSIPPYRYPEVFVTKERSAIGYPVTVPVEFILTEEENRVAYAIGAMAWTCWHSNTPVPTHPHTLLDPVATVRQWAAQRAAKYCEVAEALRYHNETVPAATPWLVALLNAAEQLAGAERIAAAISYAGRQQYKPVSTSGGGTQYTYKFAPSSHKSRRVRSCKLCAKLGRLCHIHAKRQAVTA